ncbi:diguanylate cyclase/phosphodiesterase [Burkholderiales bacterium GJ-E10]|nr:diguanylate cyclase/phosphodiesterase [Burkholderiales bacterium GJ-E10]
MTFESLVAPLFQPIANFSGKIYAYEALMRIAGRLEDSPADHIRRWEQSGFIGIADRAMVRAVAAAVAMLPYRPRIAINASVRTIETAGADYLAGLAPLIPRSQRVIVELTETAPVRDSVAITRFVGACRDSGIHVALDDCRPDHPYGSEEFIRLVRPSIIKIDGIALHQAIRSGTTKEMRRLIGIAHRQNAHVVIEYVTDALLYAYAFSIGADFVQGVHVGIPAPLPAVPAKIPAVMG